MKTRIVTAMYTPQPVVEGAGVNLKRSLPTPALDYLDPFLLLDHFGSNNPQDYLPGFPMHPHRGIETVTYLLNGEVHHRDSLGNSGVIKRGDVQWMTSGRGIMHEEMPKPRLGKMSGFQLWVNLPAALKMSQPRYQEIPSASIPEISRPDGAKIRVIAGEYDGTRGPVTEIAANPLYLDVSLPPATSFSCLINETYMAFIYVFEGEGYAPQKFEEVKISALKLAVFYDGQSVDVRTENNIVRFLLVAGKPLNEPIARYGPFVMNTKEEIEQALSDLQNGTFVS
jgi:redox-sensitive bicupin YhaK (pirin superfamily)